MASLEIRPKSLSADERQLLLDYFPIDNSTSWKTQEITENGTRIVSLFATVLGTYVCLHIETALVVPTTKARNILKHNYVDAHGSLDSLNLIGYCDIQNVSARVAMINAFDAMVKPKSRNTWLYLTPTETGWWEAVYNNPFMIGTQKLLRENYTEIGKASIGRVWFIFAPRSEKSRIWDDYELHMKIELHR